MLKYVVSQSDGENFIITVMEDGEYKGVAVKIVDLKFDETGTMDFEIELPKNKVELFKDDKFKEEISDIVGDIVKKSVDAVWKSQKELSDLEENVGKVLQNHNIKRDESKLLVEQFMEKGYLLKVDGEGESQKYVAIDIKENKVYDLSNEDEFELVRQKVFPNIITN